MNQFSRNSVLWIIIVLALVLSWSMFRSSEVKPETIPYSEFRDAIAAGKIQEVVIKDSEVKGTFVEGYSHSPDNKFITNIPGNDTELLKELREAKIKFDGRPKEEDSIYLVVFAQWLPVLIIIVLWLFLMRNLQIGGGKAMSFGKSRARLMEEGAQKVTFNDVAGIDESKAELDAIVQFLKDPKKFTKLGGRIPKGVLLVGSPGTGKTLLARAIAGEAGVPFFSISGSDFVEMFVGVGASRVRDLFLRGKKNAPCIIFIDEIDAVGRHRGAGLGGGHDEREQTLNQLLVEMDGFEGSEGVILVAATNRPDVLDPALLRPGRFDRTVVVPLPDLRGREEILKVHTRKTPIAPDISLTTIARGTPGFSGADLANLVNEAALYAALKDDDTIRLVHFEHAKDKIMMGAERRSLILTEREKETTSYHESGHAIVARLVPSADPIHKVTIVPRGSALGLMQQLPIDEKHTHARDYLLDRICISFGGRAAEELVFGEINTGATSDIQQATSIARRMVCEWGMSEKLGPLAYGKQDDAVFLGREITHQRDYSEGTAKLIDEEVRRIVDEQLERARGIVREHRPVLEALAKSLLESETLDSEQIDRIIREIDPSLVPPPTLPDVGSETAEAA